MVAQGLQLHLSTMPFATLGWWQLVLVTFSTLAVADGLQEVFVPADRQPLVSVPVVSSQSDILNTTLYMGAVKLHGPGLALSGRVFNASVPGPTLAVRPGDRLIIRLENHLSMPLGPDKHNRYHHPNVTNLHTHGLHVSPLAPQDDVLDVAVNPGESYVYDYQLPPDHSPGIYWAHPHSHGSNSAQTGAALALIVQDPADYLSPQIEAMPDHVLVLQNFNREALMRAAYGVDSFFEVEKWDLPEDLWLVNGAPNPVMTVEAGTWHRLRLVCAGSVGWLSISFGSCKVALLAKDGIYIEDFPRFVPHVQLPPGGRAEVVLNCPPEADGQMEHAVISSKLPGVKTNSNVDDPESFNIALGPGEQSLQLFTIRAVAGAMYSESHLQPWAPSSRPAYLKDLTDDRARQLRGRKLADDSKATPACSCRTSMGNGAGRHGQRWLSGHKFSGPTDYLTQWPQNAVVERRLSGVDLHPFHQHTWPFQLTADPSGGNPYFKAGDWHDTYFNPLDGKALVRFSTVSYNGPQVIHCHASSHADEGMLGVELVSGQGPKACACGLLDQPQEVTAEILP
eukprot:TRINITY_DN49093_c0_g1_i1.p1 TRINITY_DN49093_c0_g1~~TRINITY_DN49093_c0_g1_i1.p1  ORF type:complete len:566 (-),score=71.28 TRINITY_DN49093_c0_g1_i1:57-1754(-)